MTDFPYESALAKDIKSKWGLLPNDVEQIIFKKEWRNLVNLKARLIGSKQFPIKINLIPPSGRAAVDDLSRFQKFIDAWKSYPHQNFIDWESRSYRTLSEQRVPRFFILSNIQDLIVFIGYEAKIKSDIWRANMAPLLTLPGDNIYPVLVKHLSTVENMSVDDCYLLKRLAEQLSADMGVGKYLRALPLIGVDTKFLENYQILISDLLDAMHGKEISMAGGLLAWLGCLENPKGWLCVRPLCEKVKEKMGGFPILQLPIDVLKYQELPANNILVVENMQSGLGLPNLPDTIAVFGGGRNVAWTSASWLKNKRVAYWGDIDTWGLAILSDIRTKLPDVTPLMFDHKTIETFEERMVIEPEPVENCPLQLSESEKGVFYGLKSGVYKSSRLEQERLSSDYILLKLQDWLTCSG